MLGLFREQRKLKKLVVSQVQVAHTCNPSYSGGSDQENRGSKPTWAKQFTRPYLGKIHHKKVLVNSQVMETAKMPQH
jgi:hypothetical protein